MSNQLTPASGEEDVFISVVIPAYNEAKRIRPTIESVAEHLNKRSRKFEIIVVDDGSKDDTVEVVERLSANIPNLSLLRNVKNRGKGYAVQHGMNTTKGAYRLFMDADGSVHIREVERFLFYAAYGYDVVIGSISHPLQMQSVVEHAGTLRRIFGSISHALVRFFATPGIYDTQRGFKLFSAKAAQIIFSRQKIERFGFDIELIVIAQHHNLSIKEVPVTWENPAGSTVQPSDYLRTFQELFRIMNNRLAHAYD